MGAVLALARAPKGRRSHGQAEAEHSIKAHKRRAPDMLAYLRARLGPELRVGRCYSRFLAAAEWLQEGGGPEQVVRVAHLLWSML